MMFMVLVLLCRFLFNFDGCYSFCLGLHISSCLGLIFNLNNRLNSLWLDWGWWSNSIQLFILFSFNLFGHLLCLGFGKLTAFLFLISQFIGIFFVFTLLLFFVVAVNLSEIDLRLELLLFSTSIAVLVVEPEW